MSKAAAAVLSLEGLRTAFGQGRRQVMAVDGVDLAIPAGETLALVGESGSGKSVTSLSVLRLLPAGVGRIVAGRVMFAPPGEAPVDLATLPPEALRRVRGGRIGMVFQEPMTSLNPVFTVGDQIAEPLRVHGGAGRQDAMQAAVRLLDQVGIPDPGRRAGQFPHELSGGMRQRVTIAMALACDPPLLIADEPTTALDVTIQAQILDLLQRLQRERGMAMLFVTHNLGVVAEIAHRVAVMYAGRVVEDGTVGEVFSTPRHPYTIGLMASMPRLGTASALRRAGARLARDPRHRADAGGAAVRLRLRAALRHGDRRLQARRCRRSKRWRTGIAAAASAGGSCRHDGAAVGHSAAFRRGIWPSTTACAGGAPVRVLDGISFEVGHGEVVGLVGESGSGKTTIGRAVLRLIEPTAGAVMFDGQDLTRLGASGHARDAAGACSTSSRTPIASLSPRMTVGEILTEGLAIQGRSARAPGGRNARTAPWPRSSCRRPRSAAIRTNSPAASASASASPAR